MKKVMSLTLALLLLLTLASCGNLAEETEPVIAVPETTAPAEATEPEETTEPTIPAPTEPEWETGILRATRGEGLYKVFDAGTELNVIGQFLNYYVVEQDDANLLIRKEMLRLDAETSFESWNGYARYGTKVYDNAYLQGEPIATLKVNTKLTVMESSGGWAYIVWADGKGYVCNDMLSEFKLTDGTGEDGNGSGNADGTDVSVNDLASMDTSLPEILLLGAYYGPEMEENFSGGKATVLVSGTEGYISLWNRGDEVKVTAKDEETVTVWLEGELYATLPRFLVKLEGDTSYESWTGYCKHNSLLFGEYQMYTETGRLSFNKQVTVLDEVNGCYVVEYEGQIGCMEPDSISKTPFPTTTKQETTWTPPKL